jgi:hypothetical protein
VGSRWAADAPAAGRGEAPSVQVRSVAGVAGGVAGGTRLGRVGAYYRAAGAPAAGRGEAPSAQVRSVKSVVLQEKNRHSSTLGVGARRGQGVGAYRNVSSTHRFGGCCSHPLAQVRGFIRLRRDRRMLVSAFLHQLHSYCYLWLGSAAWFLLAGRPPVAGTQCNVAPALVIALHAGLQAVPGLLRTCNSLSRPLY